MSTLATLSTDTSHTPSVHPAPTLTRHAAVDILRGLVMVIMALDHVRDLWSNTPFSVTDPDQTSVPWFLTRFVTHFCAPTFVFLSGMSIYFFYMKSGSRRQTTTYLIKRGLWLILLEVVVVTFLLQFTYQLILLQVIWAIGWSMVIMALLIWLPRPYQVALAVIILAGHNLIPAITTDNLPGVAAGLLHNPPFVFMLGKLPVLAAYSILPWTGVMLLGYVMGSWFEHTTEKQRKLFSITGICVLILFMLLRLVNIYGDPAPWSEQSRGFIYTVLSFFNVTKYPPSLLFVSLTLGVAMLALAILSRVSTTHRTTAWLLIFGRVPLFYYLLHLALIVAGAYIWTLIRFGRIVNFAFMPADSWPADYTASLLRTYIVWAVVVIALYFPCRWYSRYKQKNKANWLTYL